MIEAAARAARALRAAAGPASREVRWSTPGANLHLTLAFLGEVEAARLEAVGQAVAAAAAASAGPLELQLRGAGAFPSAARPRVLWLGLGGDLAGLAALHAALASALTARGLPAGDGRFTPHLTIGRARSPRGARGLGPALAAAAPEPVGWSARALTLFESRLGPGGALHLALARAPLGQP